MKQILLGIFIMIVSGATVQAQTKTPIVNHVTITSNSQGNAVSTPTHLFNIQLMNKLNTINKDAKSEKLTQTQAQALRGKVKAIRVQELQLMKANGNRQLTAAQITELTQQLNSLDSDI